MQAWEVAVYKATHKNDKAKEKISNSCPSLKHIPSVQRICQSAMDETASYNGITVL